MTTLKQIAGPRRSLLAGDSKLISYTNAAAMNAQGVGFVAPLAAARVPPGLFAACCRPGRAPRWTTPPGGMLASPPPPAASTGSSKTAGWTSRPRKAGPAVHLRRILVYSPANAAGQAKARALKPAKATEELNRLVRTARDPVSPTPDAVPARVTAITTQRRVGAYLRTTITRGAAGKPVLSWRFDQAAIDASH